MHRKGTKWAVRYREGDRNRSKIFEKRRDADRFDAEVTRRRQLGELAALDAGRESLDDFVTQTWAPNYVVTLAPKTRQRYANLYDCHISPILGGMSLRELKTERIARWQAERLAAGAGRVAVRQALDLLSTLLQRAVEGERIPTNPVRLVRRAPRPRREEVRPLAPRTIEAMRFAASLRDATLLSVLAYAGLRPSEALALHWSDVRAQTILVQRCRSARTPTRRPISTEPCDSSRRSARTSSAGADPHRGTPSCSPDDGETWSLPAYQSWRRRAFRRAVQPAGIEHTTPYALRHSFASLLLHEGRSVIYVARQLGHDARLTLTRYGHVIDELDEQPRIDAETAIQEARVPSQFPEAPENDQSPGSRTPETRVEAANSGRWS
ncbi:MAG TPA: tyrosine-type recombinase/integrase [Solirubrobacteraceae bacterium]|nr:tyrosine-type recombinase/integrase [Solirubrobacteraceae bacterium]